MSDVLDLRVTALETQVVNFLIKIASAAHQACLMGTSAPSLEHFRTTLGVLKLLGQTNESIATLRKTDPKTVQEWQCGPIEPQPDERREVIDSCFKHVAETGIILGNRRYSFATGELLTTK